MKDSTKNREATLRYQITAEKNHKQHKEKIAIYRMKCSNYSKTPLISQTKKLVHARVREHLKEAELAKCQNRYHIRSSVAKHLIEKGHVLDKVEIGKEVKQTKTLTKVT